MPGARHTAHSLTFHGSNLPTMLSKMFCTTTMGESLNICRLACVYLRRSNGSLIPTGMGADAKLPAQHTQNKKSRI